MLRGQKNFCKERTKSPAPNGDVNNPSVNTPCKSSNVSATKRRIGLRKLQNAVVLVQEDQERRIQKVIMGLNPMED
jgi:hypothetical protein